MVNVADLYKDGRGIFSYINDVKPLPFVDVLEVDKLDNLFYAMNGRKETSVIVDDIVDGVVTIDNMLTLAEIISMQYHDKWDRLYQVFIDDLPIDTYKLTTTETLTGSDTTNSTTDRSVNSSDDNKVTGYDSDLFVDDTQQSRTETDNTTNTDTKNKNQTITKEVKGNINNKVVDMNQLVRYLKNNLIYDIIFTDVKQVISSLIY